MHLIFRLIVAIVLVAGIVTAYQYSWLRLSDYERLSTAEASRLLTRGKWLESSDAYSNSIQFYKDCSGFKACPSCDLIGSSFSFNWKLQADRRIQVVLPMNKFWHNSKPDTAYILVSELSDSVLAWNTDIFPVFHIYRH